MVGVVGGSGGGANQQAAAQNLITVIVFDQLMGKHSVCQGVRQLADETK